MKKIKYLLFILLSLMFICDVNASTIDYYKQFNGSTEVKFTKCTSTSMCTNIFSPTYDYSSTADGYTINVWQTDNFYSSTNDIGYMLHFYSNESFVSGNYYTINVLLEDNVTNNSSIVQKVGTGSSLDAYYFSNDFELNSENNINAYFSREKTTLKSFGNILSYTFKAPLTGHYVALSFKLTYSGNQTLSFYGYNVVQHGTKAPTTEDITNALSSQFKSINDNLYNMEQSIKDSINSNIDSMKDSIDNSINSDSSDTTSSSCGIVCKLKGIFTGIINLPQNIWNFLKVGFDSITNVIGDLINSITSIFVPESEESCSTPNNIFNFKGARYSYTNSPVVRDNYIASYGSVNYNIGEVNEYKGKTYTLIFNYDGTYSGVIAKVCFKKNSGSICPFTFSQDNTNTGHITFTIDDAIINSNSAYAKDLIIEFCGHYIDPVIFTNFMLIEGSEVIEYVPFGEEVCTSSEKQTFLGWLGSFFGNIISGIIELPTKLIALLIDALKSLFVPTNEQLLDIVDKSKELSENFGFVGESVNFFLNIFTTLLGMVNGDGCILLPEFTIGKTSLFDAHTFWERQQVCLADNEILSQNIDTIRTITSIALVCMFVNFAAQKFFSILNKNDTTIVDSSTGEVVG